ncbi:hypothetical protein M426DRAFT_173294 [Hypoxylon sp. CI-4A]|nr:hypothetical protein M426DRAFT_173294 [Hypoxylon sp. CI-4A]
MQGMASYPQMDPAYAAGGREASSQQASVRDVSAFPSQEANDQIPLVCYACEKHQTFSDLSHLLTHVSSKAHLLELFNLQILSQRNEASAIKLRNFDAWYQKYKISQLVLQRYEARDERGGRTQGGDQTPKDATSGRATPRRSTRGNRARRGNLNTRGRTRRIHELSEIKRESDESVGFGDGYDLEPSPIQSWQGGYNALAPHGGDLGLVHQADLQDFVGENSGSKYESSEAGSSFPSELITETTELNDDYDADLLVPKGRTYPGMGMFDSAEEEQRRKRNQRKPPLVLQQLQINSTLVSTREDVFDSNFSHQRTRDVYDDPSTDESEDDTDAVDKRRRRRGPQGRAPKTAKKARRGTVPNIARVTRSTRAAAQAAHQLGQEEDVIMSARSQSMDHRSLLGRGSASQAQLPLHGHGFHGEIGMFHDNQLGMGNELGWTSSQPSAGSSPADTNQQMLPALTHRSEDGSESWTSSEDTDWIFEGLTFHGRPDRLPGLALRPGNPNLSFASPSSGLKHLSQSAHMPGKENDGLSLKSATASSNPYLHSTNSASNESYNPLYGQARDGLGFRMYASYDNDMKSEATGFQPINGHGGFNSLLHHHLSPNYPSNQGNAEDFGI